MAAWRYEISLFNTPPTHLSLYISRICQLCQIGQIIWFSVSIELSGSARVFGYTVYRGFLNRVYGILQLKYGYSVYHFL